MPLSVYAVSPLIFGILLAHTTQEYYLWCATILALITSLTFIVLYYSFENKQYLTLSLLLLCSLAGAWRYISLKKCHNYILDTITQQKIDLTGVITDITLMDKRYMQRITMQVETIKPSNTVSAQSCHFTIHFYIDRSPTFCVDDRIAICGVYLKKNNPEFSKYLMKEGVTCSVFLKNDECILIKRPPLSLYRYIANLRSQLSHALSQKLSARTYTLIASLFLGNNKTNQSIMDSWAQLFRSWGLSHYLARSGLHLVLFTATWLLILRLTPITLALKQAVLLLLLALYALMSWPSISFYRALFTFMVCSWCIIYKKPIHYLHLLALVCSITLLYNPFHLFFLDFQLSYGLTFALGWFNYLSNRRLKQA